MHVVIIGAGVVGIAAAWHLRADGHDVTIIDRASGPATETSFANGGHVSGTNASAWAAPGVPLKVLKWLGQADAPIKLTLNGFGMPDWRLLPWAVRFLKECRADRSAANTEAVQRLAAHSRAALAELDSRLDLPRDRNPSGILNLVRSEAELDTLTGKMALWRQVGLDPQVLDAKGVLAIEPALASSGNIYAGGVYTAANETGDTHKFAAALAGHCINAGVLIHYGVTADAIVTEGGRVLGVQTRTELLPADAVVLAAGSYSPGLLSGLGVKLPVYPGKGYSITVPVGGHNAAPRVALTDEFEKIVYARIGDRLRAAGTLEFAGLDRTLPPARTNALLTAMRRAFPDGGDYTQAQAWTGLRPMTPDGRPIVGQTNIPGLWACTGHGPLGLTLSAGSGRLLAELMGGKAPSIDPGLVSPSRF